MGAFFAFLWPFLLALLCWGACVLGLRIWHLQKQNRPSALLYSTIQPFNTLSHLGKVPLLLPYILLLAAMLALLVAWWNPPISLAHSPASPWKKTLPPLPSQGLAYYLLLDHSSSMEDASPFSFPPIPKIDLLKSATSRLIGRSDTIGPSSSDLVGMIAFARQAEVLSPLTLDRPYLQDVLSKLHVVTTEEEDGTGIGYAIFKAVQLIAATRELAQEQSQERQHQHYDIHNAFIIVITDGFQEPNPLDQGKWLRTMGLEDAAAYAKKEGVKIYFINIDPTFAQESFAPHRHLLETITQLTGGEFFLLSQNDSLDALYQTIHEREATLLPLGLVSSKETYSEKGQEPSLLIPYLLVFALIGMTASVITLSTSHRMVS